MTRRIFQLIDLDRTLFDTSRFAKLITNEINRTQPGIGDSLNDQFEKAYKEEITFFLLRYLREQMGDGPFESLVAMIVEREGADTFFLPGAKERMQFANKLSDLRPAWAILTYGDAVDQFMKINILGLGEIPMLLTDTPDKGAIIASWQNADGTFSLPDQAGGEIVDTITFEDDKLRAFDNLPLGAKGLWITDNPEAAAMLLENPGDVTPVNGLLESIEYLKTIHL